MGYRNSKISLLYRPVRKNIEVYLVLLILQVRSLVSYTTDFWIGVCGAICMHASGLVLLLSILGGISNLGGWTRNELFFLYGMVMIPRGLVEVTCDGPWALRRMINNADFDRYLLRPISPAIQVATSVVSLHGIGQTGVGVALVLGSGASLSLSWTTTTAVFAIVTVISAVLILASVNFASNCLAFWDGSRNNPASLAYVSLVDFTKFPVSIFSTWVQTIVYSITPFAFVAYFPSMIILDKRQPLQWLGYCPPFVALGLVLATSLLWNASIRRYQGAGT